MTRPPRPLHTLFVTPPHTHTLAHTRRNRRPGPHPFCVVAGHGAVPEPPQVAARRALALVRKRARRPVMRDAQAAGVHLGGRRDSGGTGAWASRGAAAARGGGRGAATATAAARAQRQGAARHALWAAAPEGARARRGGGCEGRRPRGGAGRGDRCRTGGGRGKAAAPITRGRRAAHGQLAARGVGWARARPPAPRPGGQTGLEGQPAAKTTRGPPASGAGARTETRCYSHLVRIYIVFKRRVAVHERLGLRWERPNG